ncbi:MAG: radical SAM protein [Anaerolineaceae bacterium]|nr:radical SAM protein [Anaerolineaceae bacterium]
MTMQRSLSHALTPRDIGLILSYRCQTACAHCLYNCGPDWHDWMPEDEVRKALEAAQAAWGTGFQVHLTGGEPFLNFPLLLSATRMAAALGIPVYVETNAAWVRDLAQAEDRFGQLRAAGMNAVLVSVSPFHQESIPLQRSLDGITAARTVFGAARVMVYQAEWLPELARYGLNEPVPLDRYREEYGQADAGLRFWMGFGLMGGGRAGYRLGGWIPRRPAEVFRGRHCLEELAFAPHSHLDLYGNFIPSFCGGISLGDWHDLPGLAEGFRQGQVGRLARIWMDSGPFGLFQLAKDEYGYEPLPGGYVDKCHLCVDVRSHLSKRNLYPNELMPNGFYRNF